MFFYSLSGLAILESRRSFLGGAGIDFQSVYAASCAPHDSILGGANAVGNVSERSLHGLFVRHLGETLSDYLGRLRIGRACMWLVETDRPIRVIAADPGFPNLSNFNRRFRTARPMTPKEFRRAYVKHGRILGLDDQDLTKRSPPWKPQIDDMSDQVRRPHVSALASDQRDS